MTNSDTGTLLLDLAAAHFGKARAELRLEQDLFETLAIDSYQALELLTEVEDRFSIEIPDYEMQDVRTFAALAQVIDRRR